MEGGIGNSGDGGGDQRREVEGREGAADGKGQGEGD